MGTLIPIRPELVPDLAFTAPELSVRILLDVIRDRMIRVGAMNVEDFIALTHHAEVHPAFADREERELHRPAGIVTQFDSLADHGLPDGVA